MEEEEEEDGDWLAQSTRMMAAAHANSRRLGGARGRGRAVNAFWMLAGREMNVSGNGRFSRAECCHVSSRFLPLETSEVVDKIGSRCYISQFSEDGSLFVAAFQDRRIKIYDCEQKWKVRKIVRARNLRWTVTDTALSPDQRLLAYSSITPVVHLVDLARETETGSEVHQSVQLGDGGSMGVWCVLFCKEGRQLLAGSSDHSIHLYDLERNVKAQRIQAHKNDVNSVAMADDSSNVLFSGSDDHLCKVWDVRCCGRAVGVLHGHLEGITFLHSRGDARFFISNGKDQCIKLWDIRKMSQAATTASAAGSHSFKWDYRWMDYPGQGRDFKLAQDQSLTTYRGHRVLRTLIRCYFSPVLTTAQRYIYTGSQDGCVYIYDLLTGHQAAKLKFHHRTVRDCSWHPRLPMLLSSSWDGTLLKWEPTAPDDPSLHSISHHFVQIKH